MEEQELAERCRQGDNLARKELYERYAGRMLSVCLRYGACNGKCGITVFA